MNEVAIRKPTALARAETRQFVTITIDGQSFGIPVLLVHDVLGPQRITRTPLAPAEVAGSLNLRGRIRQALDAGADEYIMKPFDSEILQTKLDQRGLIDA